MGYQGTLCEIDDNFGVTRFDDIATLGSPYVIARAALMSMEGEDIDPSAKIMKALEITARCNTHCKAPFAVISGARK